VSDVAVRVTEVSKKFRLYRERNQTLKSAIMRGRTSVHEDFWALQGVTFDVARGSTFGIIGRNGSGKSTLLKCLARIYSPDSGTIAIHGRVAALLEVGTGFHPELSGRENVYLNGSILGMSRKELDRKFEQIVDFAGIERFIDQPVKTYSSGMYVRLGFSVAIHVDPDILIADEVLAVGDANFQEKCLQKFGDLKAAGKTVILVSHSLETVEQMCDQAAWVSGGKIRQQGDCVSTTAAYRNSEEYGDPGAEA
jgi:ABC-type polysaccharide/polyol phosphate transport system ATPase subunit